MSAKVAKFVADPAVGKANLSAAIEKLKTGLATVATPEGLKQHLKFSLRGNLHRFSFRNQLLVKQQDPQATHIGNYYYWIGKGRLPLKGKAIHILAPRQATKKKEVDLDNLPTSVDPEDVIVDDDGKAFIEQTYRFWKAQPMWDVRHTTDRKGNPYTGGSAGNLRDFTDLGDEADEVAYNVDMEVRKFMRTIGVVVKARHQQGCYGSYTPSSKTICVSPMGDSVGTCKTSIHEAAHALEDHLGTLGAYNLGELVAESVAFCLMDRYGLDTGKYSFAYIQGYGGDPKLLQQGLAQIQKVSSMLIEAIEREDEQEEQVAA